MEDIMYYAAIIIVSIICLVIYWHETKGVKFDD